MGVPSFSLGSKSSNLVKTERMDPKDTNQSSYPRWAKDSILPPVNGDIQQWYHKYLSGKRIRGDASQFNAKNPKKLPWEEEMEQDNFTFKPPFVDYTQSIRMNIQNTYHIQNEVGHILVLILWEE